MFFSPVEFTLKDGRTALLRSPTAADAQAALDYLYTTACETEFILRYPEECGKYTLEGEKALFERVNSSPTELMLLCFVDGELAAMSNLAWSSSLKLRHRAEVAIATVKKYWGLGIGSAMFRAMIAIAEENGQLLQLELDFIEGNSRARALYEKFGFRITAVKPNAIRLKDGTLLNEYCMVRPLHR